MNRHLLRSAPLALALALLAGCGDAPEPTADTPVPAPADTPSTSPPPVTTFEPTPEIAPTAPTRETTATVPTIFHGEWNRVLADCNTDKNDSRLRISADKILFAEGSGTVVEATQAGNELQVVVQLAVDGSVVDRRFNYVLAGNRQALTDEGTGLVRLRCVFHPKAPEPPPPEPTPPPQG